MNTTKSTRKRVPHPPCPEQGLCIYISENAVLINYFLLFLALLMLIFPAVTILYVGPERDISVYSTLQYFS